MLDFLIDFGIHVTDSNDDVVEGGRRWRSANQVLRDIRDVRRAARVPKPVNLPAWKKVGIDMTHVMRRHSAASARPGSRATTFPQSMSEKAIEGAVRSAYRHGERIATQGERVLVRGRAEGLTIDMWVNTATKRIEAAYPVF